MFEIPELMDYRHFRQLNLSLHIFTVLVHSAENSTYFCF